MNEKEKSWTLLSNHTHVLISLVRNPKSTLRDVSIKVGITERAVQAIVTDLETAGFLTREKQGRCNYYHFNREKQLRHDLEANHTIGELLDLLV